MLFLLLLPSFFSNQIRLLSSPIGRKHRYNQLTNRIAPSDENARISMCLCISSISLSHECLYLISSCLVIDRKDEEEEKKARTRERDTDRRKSEHIHTSTTTQIALYIDLQEKKSERHRVVSHREETICTFASPRLSPLPVISLHGLLSSNRSYRSTDREFPLNLSHSSLN